MIYWELDRGGPVARTQKPREELPLADLRFTQDETQDTVIEVAAGSSKKADWIPTFVDYLYLSTTNSSAFSPTDTMPLTSRAKILMGIQATAALITSLLVIARAVGALRQHKTCCTVNPKVQNVTFTRRFRLAPTPGGVRRYPPR